MATSNQSRCRPAAISMRGGGTPLQMALCMNGQQASLNGPLWAMAVLSVQAAGASGLHSDYQAEWLVQETSMPEAPHSYVKLLTAAKAHCLASLAGCQLDSCLTACYQQRAPLMCWLLVRHACAVAFWTIMQQCCLSVTGQSQPSYLAQGKSISMSISACETD